MIEKEKIATQVLFPKLNIDDYQDDLQYKTLIQDLVKRGVGGFCVFGGNLEKVEITLNYLQGLADIPLLFCADFENGLSMRIEDGNEFPHSMAIAQSENLQYAFQIGKAIAKESKSVGIHWNLAPVVDINSNKLNPVINIRSFGENVESVNQYSAEFIKGSLSENVLTCAKHFPGHGDTNLDSHLLLPTIERSLNELENNEIIPFQNAIEHNVSSIMIGHLAVKAFDNNELPASLSKNVIQYLRKKLHFKWLIITDALDMQSITKSYTSAEATIQSIYAGNNIALMPENPMEALEALMNETENDEFFKLLRQSYELIIRAKRKAGLIPQFAKLENDNKLFISHQKLALNIAFKALKMIGNTDLLPLNEKINFAGFAYLQKSEDMRAASRFFTMLAQATENDCDFAFIDSSISEDNIREFKEGILESEIVIFPVFIRSRSYNGNIENGEKLNEIIQKIAENKKIIVIVFGSPYVSENIEADLIINAFSDSFASLAAAIVKLNGRDEALNL